MPVRVLPAHPNADHLRKQAKDLITQHRAHGTWARDLVQEFHPEPPEALTLSAAQLTVARSYGFPSWPRLMDHLRVVRRYTREPHTVSTYPDPAAEFLAHACLTYGSDSPFRIEHARRLLAATPSLATTSIHAIAATADVAAARDLLDRDPSQAGRSGGPFDWEPLLYLTYCRLGIGDPAAVAALLLQAGADPNAGYLWEGLPSPFTALTGVFGGGEDTPNQPPHPTETPLATTLLAAGANPNDSQTLYNRMFTPDDSHLHTLFAHGLGRTDPGPWHKRLGPAHQTPPEMLNDVLLYAASYGQTARVALLLNHGVDPASPLRGHPMHQGRSAYELATRAGHQEIADLLAAAGAPPTPLPAPAAFLAALLRADATAVTNTPSDVIAEARAQHPAAVVTAAERDNRAAIPLLVSAGFDVNALTTMTALHHAALTGNHALVDVLLSLGADPTIEDPNFQATPAEWATHAHHPDLAAYLDSIRP